MTAVYDANSFPVKYTEADYVRMIDGLLPQGVIWNSGGIALPYSGIEYTDTPDSPNVWNDTPDAEQVYYNGTISGIGWTGSKLDLLLSCFAAEFARIESEAWAVLNQTDPGVSTGQNLSQWESLLDLSGTGTEAERQTAAHLKLFAPLFALTSSQIVSISADAGFTVTVDDGIYSDDHECGVAICGAAVCDEDAQGNVVVVVTVTAGSGSYAALESAIASIAPAHATIVWIDAR